MSKNKRGRSDSYSSDMGNPQQDGARQANKNSAAVDNLADSLNSMAINKNKKQKKTVQRELFPKQKPKKP